MQFRILGPLEVADNGRAVAVPGGKPRALLATLCLSPGETVSVERLIDELWGDDPPETAANALQVHVSQLRKALGPDAVVRRGPGYALDVAAEDVDAARFEQLVAAARDAEAGRADALLGEALALWRGDPEVDAARLAELRLAALEAKADSALALGRHADLVPELEALVEANPLRERLRGRLMRALYASGRQAEALEVYRAGRELLVEELGIDPSPELQELERAILQHDAALAAPAAPRVALPTPPTPLVGRERDLAEAVALVDGGARLVTFTGPGGIGKTRLALEVARTLAPRFAGGAAFVALAPIEDPQLVGATIAHALDVTPTTDDAVLEHVRSLELLVVLDNFEQLVDAAPLPARLLEASPRLVVLVTSRAVLRIGGERELAVPPLDAAEELFRARAPGLADDAATDDAVREICARLEGLPLAIELAAARVRLLPPPELLRRLESRLDLLTTGTRDAPERQRTMRAAIEWSYRLLEPDEQLLFARLSVFVGGADLDAIEAVCGDVATLDALASLVEKSLLRQRGTERPRFAMLEVLREFAREQLRAMGEEEALAARHAQHYLELVEREEPSLAGPEQKRVLDLFESEHGNLRAAIASAPDAASAVRLAGALRTFWYVHGHAEEGLRVLESVLAYEGDVPPLARNKALNGAAMLASERGEYAAAARFLEESLEVARSLGDRHREGVALANLGNLALYEQRWADATRLYERALPLHRAIGSLRDVAISLENLGLAHAGAGDLDRGVELLEEAVAVAREGEAPREVASASVDLAKVLIERGDTARAAELLHAAQATYAELEDRAKSADCLDGLAAVAAAEGREGESSALLAEADAVRASVGSVRQPDHQQWVDRVLK